MAKKIVKKTVKKKIGKNKQKKSQKYGIKDCDIAKIKEEIKNELYSQYFVSDNDEQIIYFCKNIEDKEKYYRNKYLKYIYEEYNTDISDMLNIYINKRKNKSFPKEYQVEPNFFHQLEYLIKRLLMTELEIVTFTILLDRIGWKHNIIEPWTYLSILGIYSKALIGKEKESALLLDIFSHENNEIGKLYNYIVEEIKNNIDEEKILNIKSINKRFNKLNRPINSYCKKDFINYNGVVDKLIKWSQPYGEDNNGVQIYNKEQAKIKQKNNIKLSNNLKGNFKEIEFIPFLPIDFFNKGNNFFTINNININMQPIISNSFNDKFKNIHNNINENNDFNPQNLYMPSLNMFNIPSTLNPIK